MKPVVGVMQAWSWYNPHPIPSHLNPTYRPFLPLHRAAEWRQSKLGNVAGKLTPRSVVISCFAIVILSVIGALFKANHHSMTGSMDDPESGATVFLVGCGFQAYLHVRENRRGAITLS
ncbi:hypothetical protein BUE80_DR004481 [Diplocarpon rosae]|nr:hypothetical protein BUE80_DR004481 [Diplocarpon rosae]